MRSRFYNPSYFIFSDHFCGLRLLHLNLHLLVLPQNASQLPGARDTQRDSVGLLSELHLLDAGQVTNVPPRGLHLHRASVQYLVHL